MTITICELTKQLIETQIKLKEEEPERWAEKCLENNIRESYHA